MLKNVKNMRYFMFLTLYYIFFSHLLQVNRGQDYEGKPQEDAYTCYS